MTESKNPPDLFDLMEQLKTDIFSTLNAIQIGRIEAVQKDKQTISAQIQIKRPTGKESSEKYPVLVDVPFFVLQGGTAYFDLPIKKGDYCIILFNDRCIDSWFENGSVSDPPKNRKHSLSDGIALVGINPGSSPRETDGTKTRIIAPDGIEMNGNTKSLVTWEQLNTVLQTFITSLNSAFATKTNGAGSPGTLSLDISSAKTTTIKTGG